jgi:Ca-activated chloride channel family protein
MQDRGKLDYLKQAAKLMVANLAPHDVFSLVTYASEVEIVSSAGTVSDPVLMRHMIDMMRASGATNLSGGLIEAIDQSKTYHGEEMLSRVILVSDGLANTGVTDPELLARYAASAAERGISVTAIGLGSDFDEDLLLALANEGQGNYYYARDPDEIPGILSAEMSGLARVWAQNVTIDLNLEPGVRFLNSLGIPYKGTARGVQFRVGQVAAGERIRMAFQLELPPAKPGSMNLGGVEIAYDSVFAPGERRRSYFPLVALYTESLNEAENTRNENVNRFVHVLAILDSMLLAKKSGKPNAIREVLQYVERELPKLQSWVQERDDREMRDLAGMLQHCLMILRQELRRPSEDVAAGGVDVAKEISYKLYRLRHHPVWEGK